MTAANLRGYLDAVVEATLGAGVAAQVCRVWVGRGSAVVEAMLGRRGGAGEGWQQRLAIWLLCGI